MADIKLDIVNQALTAAGEEMLTALAPGTTMGNAACTNYEPFVGEELENGTWKFATKVAAPTLLTALADKPNQYRWQIPAEAIAVYAVQYCGRDLDGEDAEIEGRIVRTRFNSNIKVKYGYRPDEGIWPQRFRSIIVGRLKALFMSVSERHAEAEQTEQRTDMKSKIAKHTEARQSRNRPLGDGTLAQARLGGRRRRAS